MRITSIALIILGIFAIIGGMFSSIALHEITHKIDFMSVEKTNENLCLLAYPQSGILGYYEFETNENTDQIDKYAELKAYGVTITVASLLVFCFTVALTRFKELIEIEKKEEKNLKRILYG